MLSIAALNNNKLIHHRSNPMAGPRYSLEPRIPTISDNGSVAISDPHPSWSPEVQHAYPCRHWAHDVMTWSVYTGLTEDRKAPAVELVLAGTARDLVREIPLDQNTRGVMGDLGEGQGHRHITGLGLIIRLMLAHFAHLHDEEASRQLMEMYTFRRRPGKSMGACIARYTVMSHRVASINGLTLSPGQRAFFLMAGTGCTQAPMWQFPHTLNGRLPTDEVQFQHVIEHMRRYGHMVGKTSHMPTKDATCLLALILTTSTKIPGL